jgi:WD40 repeat protein
MRCLILLPLFILLGACAPVEKGPIEKVPQNGASSLQLSETPEKNDPLQTNNKDLASTSPTSQVPRATPLPPITGFVDFERFSYILNYDNSLISESTDEIINNAVSPDGKFIAVSGATREGKFFLYILDTQNGIKTSIPIDNNEAFGLAFFPTSDKLVYATNPLGVSVWNLPQQKVERVLWQENRNDSLPVLAVSPNGKLVALAYGKQLIILEASSGREVANVKGYAISDYYVRLPKFSRDGTRLAIFTDYRRTITIYDTFTWNPIKVIEYSKRSSYVDFSADGNWLATSEFIKPNFWGLAPVLLLNVDTLKQIKLQDKLDGITDIAFAPDDSILIVSGGAMTGDGDDSGDIEGSRSASYLSVWDFSTQRRLGEIVAGEASIITKGIWYSQDSTSIILVDGSYYHVFRAEPPIMVTARETLMNFQKAIMDKDYEYAVTLVDPFLPSFLDLYLDQGGEELSVEKRAERLESICNMDNHPCMDIRRILLGTYNVEDGVCQFELQFTAPDGSLYEGEFGSSQFVSLNCDGTTSVEIREHPIFTLYEDNMDF